MKKLFLVILCLLLATVLYWMAPSSSRDESLSSSKNVGQRDRVKRSAPVQRAKHKKAPLAVSAKEVLVAVNVLRAEYAAAPFKLSPALTQVAATRVFDMYDREYFAHVSPLGESVQSVAGAAGYSHLAIAENLAKGQYASPDEVIQEWLGNARHRKALLSQGYVESGVALKKLSDGTFIISQVFGVPLKNCPQTDAVLAGEYRSNVKLLEKLGVSSESILTGNGQQEDAWSEYSADIQELLGVTVMLRQAVEKNIAAHQACLRKTKRAIQSVAKKKKSVNVQPDSSS